MNLRTETHSAEETRSLGRRLGEALHGGEVICLEGPLGAGKTTLIQGLAQGLGVGQPVTSPTFVIAAVYEGSELTLSHLDLYRLSDPSEFTAAGLEDALWDQSVCAIEWAEKVIGLLPEDRIWVRLSFAAGPRGAGRGPDGSSGPDRREILWEASGSRSEAAVTALGQGVRAEEGIARHVG